MKYFFVKKKNDNRIKVSSCGYIFMQQDYYFQYNEQPRTQCFVGYTQQ